MRKFQHKNPKILVVGDLMLDHYIWGGADRISPEAPVQVIDVKTESEVLGGAGNVVNNLIELGAEISLASVIGQDEHGDRLLNMLDALKVDTRAIVREKERLTTRKSRIIASQQQILRFDSESRQAIKRESESSIELKVRDIITNIDAIIISDYGKGVLSETLTQKIIQIGRDNNKYILVDPKGNDYTKYRNASLITPNKKEACEATGMNICDTESLKKAGFRLRNDLKLDTAIITLSEDGIAIFDEKMRTIPTIAKEVYDVTGAGDTVIATIGFVMASGGDIDESTRIANAAAAVVVGKVGSATASWDEIIECQTALHESTTEHHIRQRDTLMDTVQRLKAKGLKIAFTNGCFDILHLGHVKYLEVAKSFADVLIVAVNSDRSVRELKGESRPINPEYDRAYLLAALESVDYTIIFDEDTPYDLIEMIKPDVLIKGGDYENKTVVGSDIVNEVRLVDFVDGKSTTSIINKIVQ